MSEAALDTTPAAVAPSAPVDAPAAAEAPAAAPARPDAVQAALSARRQAAAAILRGAQEAKPPEPAPVEAESAPEPERPEPPKVEPPKAQPQRKGSSPFAEYRARARELERERQQAAAEREAAARQRAEVEAERQALAKEREAARSAAGAEAEQARRLIELAQREPERALSLLAQLSGTKSEEIIRRIATRMTDGPGADDARQEVSALEKKFSEQLAAERAERERIAQLLESQKAERERQAQAYREQAQQQSVADAAARFVATAHGLEDGAPDVLRQQAENLPHVAAMAKAHPERVERAVRAIMRDAYAQIPDWEPTHSELNKIALHLESRYRSEYEGINGVLGKKSPAAAPLGAPAAQAPGSLTQTPVSASGSGSPPRVDIAAASGTGMRREMTAQERRRAALEILAKARDNA